MDVLNGCFDVFLFLGIIQSGIQGVRLDVMKGIGILENITRHDQSVLVNGIDVLVGLLGVLQRIEIAQQDDKHDNQQYQSGFGLVAVFFQVFDGDVFRQCKIRQYPDFW